jgi:CubicO group peptidase (beta-lactamase class C family)
MQLSTFADEIGKRGLNVYGVVVRQHGREMGAHFWRTDERINIHSLSKSFLSCGVGIAMEEGLMHLDEQVIACFPDKLDQEPDEFLKKLTVRRLLTMSPGHSQGILMGEGRDELADQDWVHYFLNTKMDFEPGTRFAYDTGATFLLSAMLQRKTGMTALEYLKPRLFFPLGIRNPQWFTSPDGITLGGGGLHLNTREIGRFGQMLLDGGKYEGAQLVPQAYLAMATKKQIENEGTPDWRCGYGFQFWMCAPKNVYRGDGKHGQFCIVCPDQDAVIAITSHEEKNLQGILTCVWDTILPQLG